MLFQIGKVKVTRAVLESEITAEEMISAFARYINGDWGDGDYASDLINDLTLVGGERVIATYTTNEGHKFCMTTRDGVTHIQLPYELGVACQAAV